MFIKRMRRGYCPVCKKRTVFISFDCWLRESYKCIICRSKPRQRAVIKVLDETFPDWRNMKIYESSPDWGKSRKFALKNCCDYEYSYFYEEKQPGTILNDSCTNQNLENLTYANEVFDVVITQDVFEHVDNPFQAFREIARVLKPGGRHIFTVPIDAPLRKTVPRITLENGVRKAILPEIYHGNPIDKEKGSLVTYDWGNDICELIEECSGMHTSIVEFDKYYNCAENVRLGLEAYSLYVLVSRKDRKISERKLRDEFSDENNSILFTAVSCHS